MNRNSITTRVTALTLMLLAAVLTALSLAAGDSGTGFDPTNPGDPGATFRLRTACAPDGAGYTSPSEQYLPEGEKTWVSADNGRGAFRFQEWREGTEVVSTEPSFEYTMPRRNVTLTAWYVFDPEGPGNPEESFNLRVYITPSSGGSVSESNVWLHPGEERELYAYPASDYHFSCWKDMEGNIISIENPLHVTMGRGHKSYVAQFVFDPADPGNPRPNMFDVNTGRLVIDDFMPGSLRQTAEEVLHMYHKNWSSLCDFSDVTDLVVKGIMNENDLNVTEGMVNCVSFNFSATSGYNDIPEWAFCSLPRLTDVYLPSCIENIRSGAFDDCPEFAKIHSIAPKPPVFEDRYDPDFADKHDGLLARVPSNVYSLYDADKVWHKLLLRDPLGPTRPDPDTPAGDGETAIRVHLPSDFSEGRYINDIIKVSNTSARVSREMTVTTEETYLIKNLVPGISYDVELLTSSSNLLTSKKSPVVAKGTTVDVYLDVPARAMDVSMTVYGNEDVNLTEKVIICWYRTDNTLLGYGNKLSGMPAGTRLKCQIWLPEELKESYAIPSPVSHTVSANESDNALVCHLRTPGSPDNPDNPDSHLLSNVLVRMPSGYETGIFAGMDVRLECADIRLAESVTAGSEMEYLFKELPSGLRYTAKLVTQTGTVISEAVGAMAIGGETVIIQLPEAKSEPAVQVKLPADYTSGRYTDWSVKLVNEATGYEKTVEVTADTPGEYMFQPLGEKLVYTALLLKKNGNGESVTVTQKSSQETAYGIVRVIAFNIPSLLPANVDVLMPDGYQDGGFSGFTLKLDGIDDPFQSSVKTADEGQYHFEPVPAGKRYKASLLSPGGTTVSKAESEVTREAETTVVQLPEILASPGVKVLLPSDYATGIYKGHTLRLRNDAVKYSHDTEVAETTSGEYLHQPLAEGVAFTAELITPEGKTISTGISDKTAYGKIVTLQLPLPQSGGKPGAPDNPGDTINAPKVKVIMPTGYEAGKFSGFTLTLYEKQVLVSQVTTTDKGEYLFEEGIKPEIQYTAKLLSPKGTVVSEATGDPTGNGKVTIIELSDAKTKEAPKVVVLLPTDFADGRYNNLPVTLANEATGYQETATVTGDENGEFTFGNLEEGLTFTAALLDKNGKILSQKESDKTAYGKTVYVQLEKPGEPGSGKDPGAENPGGTGGDKESSAKLIVKIADGDPLERYKGLSVKAAKGDDYPESLILDTKIADEREWAFEDVEAGATYRATLTHTGGFIMADVTSDPTVKGETTVLIISPVKWPHDVTLKVLTPKDADGNEEDVTDRMTIKWVDSENNSLGSGNRVKNVMEGEEIRYLVILPEDMRTIYKSPTTVTHIVDADDSKNQLVYRLQREDEEAGGEVGAFTSNLVIHLPEDCAPAGNGKHGKYHGDKLRVTNNSSKEQNSLLVGDAPVYPVNDMPPGCTYLVELLSPNGDLLTSATSEETEAGKTTHVYLENALSLHDVTLRVIDENGKDLTKEATATWTDNSGKYLTSGNVLCGVLEGRTVKYRIALPMSLRERYETPGEGMHVVSREPEANLIVIELVPRCFVTISGKVITDDPSDVTVTVTETIGDETYVHTYTPDNEGRYSAEVHCEAELRIEINKPGHEPTIIIRPPNPDPDPLPDVTPEKSMGVRVKLAVTEVPAVPENEPRQEVPVTSYSRFNYSFRNETMKRNLYSYDLTVQYPVVGFNNGRASEGDLMSVKVSRYGYITQSKEFTAHVIPVLDEPETVEVEMVEQGGIRAHVASSEDYYVKGYLFREDGSLYTSREYSRSWYGNTTNEATLNLTHIPAGTYTLVTIGSSRRLAVGSLDDIRNTNLIEGEDYMLHTVEVTDGIIRLIEISDLKKPRDPDFENLSVEMHVNKQEVNVSNIVTVSCRVKYDKDTYRNAKLHILLPEGCEFVDGSLIVQKHIESPQWVNSYTKREFTITLNEYFTNPDDPDLGRYYNLVRFCVKPKKGGDFYPSGAYTFDYSKDGNHYSKVTVGNAYIKAEDFRILMPGRTCRESVFARGSATQVSRVQLFDNNFRSTLCHSDASGIWVDEIRMRRLPDETHHIVSGEITTRDGEVYPTAPASVDYEPGFPEPNPVKMMYTGAVVSFDHYKARTSPKSYTYNPPADQFSFSIEFSENRERVRAVTFRILASDGSIRDIEAAHMSATDTWVAAIGYPNPETLPINVSVAYDYAMLTPEGDKEEETLCHYDYGYIAPPVTPIIDPSGFVYEGVEENRVEGATATIFYRKMEEDIHGDVNFQEYKWDAGEYDQENPLLTDSEGRYNWDVPQGEWQVRVEKEGYEGAASEWLPVPPPQLEVNIPISRNTHPAVKEAFAYESGVEIVFDTYMDAASLTTDNIYLVVNGEMRGGAVQAGDGKPVTRIRFVPSEPLSMANGTVFLVVSRQVRSYAGIPMLNTYNQELFIEKEITAVTADNSELVLGREKRLRVHAEPAEASRGKKMVLSAPEESVVSYDTAETDIDANGDAFFSLRGELPGSDFLTFTVVDGNAEGKALVEVASTLDIPEAPVISRASGTLHRGTEITISTDEVNGRILYTTDGSSPYDREGSRAEFSAQSHIALSGDSLTLRAITITGDKEKDMSKESVARYALKRSNLDLTIEDGWTWISHNMESGVAPESLDAAGGVTAVMGRDEETVKDPVYGFVGSLSSLSPKASYKVKAEGTRRQVRLSDVEWNPATPIAVASGWNWLGYPQGQAMTLDEAFATTQVKNGDMIVGQDGIAQFDGGSWTGTLGLLEPGKGYMYKSGDDKEIVFNTSTVSTAAASRPYKTPADIPFIAEKYRYPDVAGIIGELQDVDGFPIQAEGMRVVAFCGSECRGVSETVDGLVMMSINGNAGDRVDLKLIKEGSDELHPLLVSETVELKVDGTLADPLPLRLATSQAETIRDIAGSLSLSCSDRILKVGGVAPCEVDRIDIHDLDGRLISRFSSYRQEGVSLRDLLPGTYIVSVEAGDSHAYLKVIF